MFVGITRAQQELQLSLSQYRDFRGIRKPTVPSSFLMELPRGEMDMQFGTGGASMTTVPMPIDLGFEIHPEFDDGPVIQVERCAAPPSAAVPVQLKTAAEMANGGVLSPPPSPDVFEHGMVVRHPEYGLGRIVALSGSGADRKATVDFASKAGRQKFVLSASPLRPVKS
jgi:DNA helicase-2/ATP-dependent DNA helicase PcrA